jgi:hypothetical protein
VPQFLLLLTEVTPQLFIHSQHEQNTAEGMEAGGAGICGTGGDIGASSAGGALMTAVCAPKKGFVE